MVAREWEIKDREDETAVVYEIISKVLGSYQWEGHMQEMIPYGNNDGRKGIQVQGHQFELCYIYSSNKLLS